jgi:GMP synthase (glutamine-hydrolysing)
MRTLIVTSYRGEWAPKIGPVAEMVNLFSESDVVSDTDLSPEYDLARYQAVVLSGSPNLISKGQYLSGLVDFLRREALPTLGICYGHQMLAVAHGARVIDGGKFLEGMDKVRVLVPEPLFIGLPQEIVVMESHREHVVLEDLAHTGFNVLANSRTSDVEAMRHKIKPLFGLQFHLERSGDVGRQVMENFFTFAKERAGNTEGDLNG